MTKNYNLIGISGKKGSGKDTFFNIIEQCIPSYYENKKFATNVKRISSIITGRPESHFYDRKYYNEYLEDWNLNIRQIQQIIGTEVFRNNFDEDVWIKSLFSTYIENKSSWMITDTRFVNEANAIKKRNGILIRINRLDGFENDGDKHASEIDLDDYSNWDFIINNDGDLEQFEEKCKNLINQHILPNI